MRLALFLLAALCFFTSSALADEALSVRLSQKDAYERLVFGAGQAAEYDVSPEGGNKIIISFTGVAAPSPGDLAGIKGQLVSGVKFLSAQPLRLEITLKGDLSYRHFRAGGRIMLDVMPADGELLAAPAQPEVKKPVAPAETQVQASGAPSKNKEAEKPASKKIEDPPQARLEEASPLAKVPPKEVRREELPLPPEPASSQALGPPRIPESKVGETIVTFSSAAASSMAVYQRAGQAWMINSDENMIIDPQITGAQRALLGEPVALDVPSTKSYRMPMVAGAQLSSQGGGLLWRVVQDEKGNAAIPIAPQRENVPEGGARGGAIIWPFQEAAEVVDVNDPVSGRTLKVVTVGSAREFTGPALRFVDFDVLPSVAGMAILPKVDDLEVKITAKGVVVSRPGAGLAALSESRLKGDAPAQEAEKQDPQDGAPQDAPAPDAAVLQAAPASLAGQKRIFDFQNWQMGGPRALEENRVIVMSNLTGAGEQAQVDGLVSLGKMYLANGFAPEASGFFNLAASLLPDLRDNPVFVALRGAAMALEWHSEDAFNTLSAESLKQFPEIAMWRAFALADLGDWQQAAQILPQDVSVLAAYPLEVQARMAPALAEIALRAGNVGLARQILDMMTAHEKQLSPPQEAALNYLRGEAARQSKDLKTTKALWEKLSQGQDDLYRVKAGLALSRLQVDNKEIKPVEAIDTLERLRYAWRGDELEGQVNYWLGRTYFESGQYSKGLTIMKDAATYAGETNLAQRIQSDLSDAFIKLYSTDALKKVSPLDAAALFEQFAAYVPAGAQGDLMAERLADHLLRSDLLDRAGNLMQRQIDQRLKALDAYKAGVRVAAIRLLDEKPQRALEALNKAASVLGTLPEAEKTPERYREMALLRARALAQVGRPDQAIALLRQMPEHPDISRLKAEIAWNARYWEDASAALEDVILDQDISLTRPLKPEHAALILQRALALNLAEERTGLANMRQRYLQAMQQTDKGRIFEVITREQQSIGLADRETMLEAVAEVDLFGDFLNAYRSSVQEQAKQPAPAQAESKPEAKPETKK